MPIFSEDTEGRKRGYRRTEIGEEPEGRKMAGPFFCRGSISGECLMKYVKIIL